MEKNYKPSIAIIFPFPPRPYDPMKKDEKWMWIVTGPNGAGKTTLWNSPLLDKELGEWGKDMLFLDPNQIQETLIKERSEAGKPFLSAVALSKCVIERCDAEMEKREKEGKSFAIEMTAPRDDILRRAERLQKNGWKIGAVAVGVANAELAENRVHDRVVIEGGHEVAHIFLNLVYTSCLNKTPELMRLADKAFIFDNSETATGKQGAFKLIARQDLGQPLKLTVDSKDIPKRNEYMTQLLANIGMGGRLPIIR